MSAAEVAAAVSAGLRRAGAEAQECPVADGGEGTIEVLRGVIGGELRSAITHDPLGRPLEAPWLWLAERRTAILEMAQASGLALMRPASATPSAPPAAARAS
jgi:glycerate kinase